MQIEMLKLADIKPYGRNPRRNDKAVPAVASSIKNFGFKVPIVIDADGVIVNGHTRYKAAQKLGLEEVPCIRADDLTPEQINAFRIADNKVGEIAEWDMDLLSIELKELNFNMEGLGFDKQELGDILNIDFTDRIVAENDGEFHSVYEDSPVTEEYLNYNKVFSSKNPLGIPDLREDMIADIRPTGTYNARTHVGDPCMLWAFGSDSPAEFGKSYDVRDSAVCFYVDDNRFQKMWTNTQGEIEKIKRYGFKYSVALDFSINDDMPPVVKLNQKFRSMWVNRMMQEMGIKIIPSVTMFSKPNSFTYDYDFAGIPSDIPLLSIQLQNIFNSGEARDRMLLYRHGIERVMRDIRPKAIMLYCNVELAKREFLPLLPTGIEYVLVNSWSAETSKARKKVN